MKIVILIFLFNCPIMAMKDSNKIKLLGIKEIDTLLIPDFATNTISIFIDKYLENNVREFLEEYNQKLSRKEYLKYFKALNYEFAHDKECKVKFLATYRGSSYEILKEDK